MLDAVGIEEVEAAARLVVVMAEGLQADGRAPTRRDWQAMSRRIHATLEERIRTLEGARDLLGGCVGCGCLSLGS